MNQKILFLLLALVFSFVVRGQDIIYKTDGTEIKAKVIEIDENVVKYKNFDQLDGPLRSIGKIQVFLIIYANGQREKFETPKKEEMQPEPKEYQTAEIIKQPFEKPKQDNTLTKNYLDMKVEQAKTMENVGKGMFYGGFIGVGVGFLTAISSSDGIAGDIVMLVWILRSN